MDNKYKTKGTEIGALVDQKNKQYGDSFNRAGEILKILYPDGVKPDQYKDLLAVARVLDKLFRVAHGKQGNEDPWQDIAGYGILRVGDSRERVCDTCRHKNKIWVQYNPCHSCNNDNSAWTPRPEITGGD